MIVKRNGKEKPALRDIRDCAEIRKAVFFFLQLQLLWIYSWKHKWRKTSTNWYADKKKNSKLKEEISKKNIPIENLRKDIVNILKSVDALEQKKSEHLISSCDAEQKEGVNTPQKIVPFQVMFQDKLTRQDKTSLQTLNSFLNDFRHIF